MFQRLSMLIQRFNVILLHHSFIDEEAWDWHSSLIFSLWST